MKILQVMAGGEHGGAETAFVDMCLALHEGGSEIEVVTRSNAVRVPALQKAGIKVHALPFGGKMDVFTGWKLGRIIKDFSPLIVQTWMGRATQKTPNWKALKSPQQYVTVARLGGYYNMRNFKSADYFIANTEDIKRHILEGGIKENRVRVITNFAPVEGIETPVRKIDLDTPEDAPVLLALGRLHINKAHDVLLRALVHLPGVYAWIAGEGDERAALEKLAAELNVADRVRFLGWRTDRAALLAACDICVFVSRIEPFGNVYVQAWAAKVPVVVSDAAGMQQYCHNGQDCLMVPREDAEATAQAVLQLLQDTSLQQKLVAGGYETYKAGFTKERSVSNYLDFYLEILKREGVL